MLARQLVAAATTAVVAAGLLALNAVGPVAPAAASPASSGTRDVIVHLFQWPWDSIASECAELSKKGFGAVQVSPPQEHPVLPGKGHPWWQDYQPVSYTVASRRGDEKAFGLMVQACHKQKVKIYVDVIVNHMAGGDSTGNGFAGSEYSQYSYPAVGYTEADFHRDECKTHRWEIENYDNHDQLVKCELKDLSDLKTENPTVQEKIRGYLTHLVRDLHVDGFRVDAAKHIEAGDLKAILAPVTSMVIKDWHNGGNTNTHPYVYSEVIGKGGLNQGDFETYAGVGDITEFEYGRKVGTAFRDENLLSLKDGPAHGLMASEDAIVFIDNHDTQRTDAKLNYKAEEKYYLASAYMLAWPFGTPKVMSGYKFSSFDQGPPLKPDQPEPQKYTNTNGTTAPATCAKDSEWVCEHRNRAIANMVKLRHAAWGKRVTHKWSQESKQIAFGREDKAYVAFNQGTLELARTFETGLPAGTYCDVMNAEFDNGVCAGPSYQVDAQGKVAAKVPARGALALHVDARVTGGVPGEGCNTVATAFEAKVRTVPQENVFVTGDTTALGNWDPAKAVPLSAASYPVWKTTVDLPANAVQYKYIKKKGTQVIWENDPYRNRTTPTTGTCTVTLNDTWH